MALSPIFWDLSQNPLQITLDQVFDNLRNDDMAQGLMYDPCTLDDILEDCTLQEDMALDGIVLPFVKMEYKMRQMKLAMNRVSGDLEVLSYQISQPFMRLGTANIVAIFELSDGQTVSIYFHNPDVTPKKIQPQDELISFKWLLNKKDVTIVVAPERGQEIDIRQVAMRIMKIAKKNSTAFVRQNQNRAQRAENLVALEKRIQEKEKTLKGLLKEIDTLQYLKAESQTEQLLKQQEQQDQELPPSNIIAENKSVVEDAPISSQPNKPILVTGNEFGEFDTNTQEGRKALREKAFEHLKTLADNQETVFCNALASEVGFTRNAAKKYKSTTNPIKSKLALRIKEIIANGEIFKPSQTGYDNTERNKMIYHYLKTPVKVGEQNYWARIVIREDNNGKFHYDLQVKDQLNMMLDSVETSVPSFVNSKLGTAYCGVTPLPSKKYGGDSSTESVALRPYRFKECGGDSSTENDSTLILDDMQPQYVLNLFLFDENGNPIPDEEEEATLEPEQPIMITGNEFGEFDTNTQEGKAQLREKVREFLENNLKGKWIYNAHLDREIEIRQRSIKEFIFWSANPKKLKLATAIEKIIATAKATGTGFEENIKQNQKRNVVGYFRLGNKINIEGEFLDIQVIIEQDEKGLLHYDVIIPKTNVLGQTIPDTKSGVNPSTKQENKSLVTDDTTLVLDDMQPQYVLNLFLFDENGNPVADEWEDKEDKEESEFNQDKAFLQAFVDRTIDDPHSSKLLNRLRTLGEKYHQDPTMQDLLNSAILAFQDYLDELSR